MPYLWKMFPSVISNSFTSALEVPPGHRFNATMICGSLNSVTGSTVTGFGSATFSLFIQRSFDDTNWGDLRDWTVTAYVIGQEYISDPQPERCSVRVGLKAGCIDPLGEIAIRIGASE